MINFKNRFSIKIKSVTLIIVLIFSVCNCGLEYYTKYEEVNIMETFGPKYSNLQGRVYRIQANGNEFMSQSDVRKWALARAATIAHEKGYSEFTIFDEHKDSMIGSYNTTTYDNVTAYTYGQTAYGNYNRTATTMSIPRTQTHTYTTHQNNIIIILITKDDYKDVNNVYLVNDYLPKEDEIKTVKRKEREGR